MSGPLNTTSPTTPQRVEQALRAHQAVIMRRDRASYEEIAERLGYHDRASAYRAVYRYITKMATSDDVQALRQLEADGLDALQRNYLVRAKGDIAAAKLVLDISARRSRLLGLDRNEQRIGGALEASAVADIAQVSMLQAALVEAMNDAGMPLDLQDRLLDGLNRRLASEPDGAGDVIKGEVDDD